MNKPQRIRITEPGWGNYTGYFGTVEFSDGLSTEIVDSVTANRLGSIIRMELCDTESQAGGAATLIDMHETAAEVVAELPQQEIVEAAEATEVAAEVVVESAAKYTRESLEATADKNGIAGLREIAEKYGVRGRGIAELIEEILAAQAAK